MAIPMGLLGGWQRGSSAAGARRYIAVDALMVSRRGLRGGCGEVLGMRDEWRGGTLQGRATFWYVRGTAHITLIVRVVVVVVERGVATTVQWTF